MGIIYKATNKVNGKGYVGQTKTSLGKRIDRHCRAAIKQQYRYPFINAIRKYGENAFTWEILECDVPDDELNAAEIRWIAHVRSAGTVLYNVSEGGTQRDLTPEGRARIGTAAKGNKYAVGYSLGNKHALGHRHTDAAKAKISDAGKGNKYNLGRKQSDEERAIRSLALKGKRIDFRHSEETKVIIRLKRKQQVRGREKTYNVTLRSPIGIDYGPITNVAAFAREHALNTDCLYDIISGKRPTHKGWICLPLI